MCDLEENRMQGKKFFARTSRLRLLDPVLKSC